MILFGAVSCRVFAICCYFLQYSANLYGMHIYDAIKSCLTLCLVCVCCCSDSESWVGHFYRDQQQIAFRSKTAAAMNSTATTKNTSEQLTQQTGEEDATSADNTSDSEHEKEMDALELASRWGFNASKPTKVHLPSGVWVTFPLPIRPSCQVALPLLKYLAEFSYRPNDLSAQALEQFMVQDYAGALKLFDEAAELGLEQAQLNSAFLYKFLLSSPLLLPNVCHQMIESQDNRQHCEVHFRSMLQRRLVQLAHMNNPEGFRELADFVMLSAESSAGGSAEDLLPVIAVTNDQLQESSQQQVATAGKLYAHSALKYKDITSLMSLANLIKTGGISGIPKNITLAKELYHIALEWERGSSKKKKKKKNKNKSASSNQQNRSSFLPDGSGLSSSSEVPRESILPSRVYTYNDLGVTTGGVAPAVALLGIYVEEAIDYVKSVFASFRA
jgi:TPR repeat protein